MNSSTDGATQGEAQRIEGLLRQRVGKNWLRGQRLPPIKELARELQAGQNNTLLAVQTLVRDGLLKSHPRRGTFVAGEVDPLRQHGLRVPGLSSKALADKEIALIIPWRRPQTFVQRALDEIHQVLRACGARSIRTVHTHNETTQELADCAGLILINPDSALAQVTQRHPHIPGVVIETAVSNIVGTRAGFDFVGFDSDHAACLAGQHLRAAGCTRICFLGCTLGAHHYDRTSTARFEGLCAGWGQPIPPELQLHCPNYMSVPAAKVAVEYLQLNPRPDGICAASDELAIGFVHGAAAHGLEAGRDYQIVGFDGQDAGRSLSPGPLTSIAAPMAAMGRLGAELLVRRVLHPGCPPCRVFLPGKLQKGATTTGHFDDDDVPIVRVTMSASPEGTFLMLRIFRSLSAALLLACHASAAIQIPLQVEPSTQSQAPSWPVTVGVPFAKDALPSVDTLTVTDESGASVACQITKLEPWDNGSVRWAWVDFQPQPNHHYTLVEGKAPAAAVSLKVAEKDGQITIDTGVAQYTFKAAGGSFDTISVNGKPITTAASDGFYVIDSKGRQSTLRAAESKIELTGPMHAVIRVAGEYKTPDNARNAAAVVYYHFYAGRPEVRITHKLIVTENTNDLWFREIGLRLPLAGATTATFNKPDAALTDRVQFPVTGPLVMLQKTYPHFGQRDSQCEIIGANIKGAVAGNWADLSSTSGGGGLAAQIPAFAQTFPKAFALSSDALTIKLWASEAGQELDFRTEKIMDWYFGADWVAPDPADDAPKAKNAEPSIRKVKNNAQGTARTHDIWLYPHAGPLDDKTIATFGAVTEPVIARIDPQWIAATGVMGPLHPYDPQRFPAVERALSEHFDRAVGFPLILFPTNGYLYYRGYPYASQPWEVRNAQWYPTNHRTSRNLEYNFKRHIWVLAARGGPRRYFDLARDYTRMQHDMLWSNCDTEGKPTRGRLYQGNFHSPIVWAGTGAYLAYASSEDVVQFVYDYFLTGEYHSRDMAEAWIAALKTEYGDNVDKAVKDQDRTDSLLRMIGSGYELHHDPYLAKFSHAFLEHTVKPKQEVGLDLDGSQIAKTGDVYSAYFYNWVHTRDPLALVPLKRFAEFDYRRGLMRFQSRSSAMPFAYAMKYLEDGDANYAGMLSSWMQFYGDTDVTLAQLGIDPKAIKPGYTGPFGHHILTGSAPTFYGLPMAMYVNAKSGVSSIPRPLAEKPAPTQRAYLLLNRTKADEATLDIAVNNFGDLTNEPRLTDAKGNAVPLKVIERNEHRVTKPPGIKGVQAFKEYYMMYESLIFYRLQIPAGGATGTLCLDLGDQVSFKVLDSSIPQVSIAAPDGIVIIESHRYYFSVAADVQQLTAFSHRPVAIYDPSGKLLPQTLLDPREVKIAGESVTESRYGKFTVDTGGRAGIYSVIAVEDSYMMGNHTSSDTFFRLENAPLVLAMDEPKRLFAVDASRYPSSEPKDIRTQPADGFAYVDSGKFDRSILLAGKVISVPTDAATTQPPIDKGTVEFWWRPRWSAGDIPMSESTQRLQMFDLGHLNFGYTTDNPNQGRTSYYNESRLTLFLPKHKDAKYESETRAIIYPTAGQWYHVALTWNLDGKNSEIDLYLNGRKRSYGHYNDGLPRSAAAADLAPIAELMRLGSARFNGWAPGGDEFDELRISRSVRYTQDFEPPTQPFTSDADTWLLMHFDGDLKAQRNKDIIEGSAKAERRLY